MTKTTKKVLEVLKELIQTGDIAIYGVDFVDDKEAPLEAALIAWKEEGMPIPGEKGGATVHYKPKEVVYCNKSILEGTEDYTEVTCGRCKRILIQEAEKYIGQIEETIHNKLNGNRIPARLHYWRTRSLNDLRTTRDSWKKVVETLS